MVTTDIFSTIGDLQLSQKAHKIGLIGLIREGLPPQSVFSLQKTVRFSNVELEIVTGISYRTLRRYMEKNTQLPSIVSDRVVRFLNVLKSAADSLGSIENGVAWMHRPCQPLGGQTPINLLDTEAGTSEVVDVLGRIRHGIFS